MNKITSRCGNAVPLSSVSGIASAVAKDTTPRIPAHEIINVSRHLWRIFRASGFLRFSK